MDRRNRRVALGVALLALGVAAPAQAAPGISVSSLSSLKAGATAGTLQGTVVNDTGKAKRADVAVRIFRRGTDAPVVGRTAVNVAAHGKVGYSVKVALPSSLKKGNYYLGACTSYGKGDGSLGCATAVDDVLIKGGDPVRPALAKAAQAPAECSAGGYTLQPAGSRLYPETGNTGYQSLHTDIHLVYDAPSNLFLNGTYVDLKQKATQCLSSFSLDFERTNAVTSTTTPGPNLAVQEITINGVPATFTFKQPTFPGNPNGLDDPNPLAHAASNSNPVSATNPNPPACAPTGNTPALQGVQCPATKLVITPSAPIPAGSEFNVQVKYTGRPGVHVDGDGATEGWFRNNNPVGDGGFMTTEPVGSMSWMPLNNHPTVKPTYEFWSTTNWDSAIRRTAISNGRLIGFTDNAADTLFPGGSRTWHWKSPEPIANYLVENSIGDYEMTERVSPSGIVYYTAQASAIMPATRKASNLAIMNQHEDITNFQIPFNGPFPFSTNGVIIGLPSVSFAEEMQTKITFPGGSIGLGTFHHENMHQWWGDNVSEDIYERTFFKEGYADLSEGYNNARTAATTAGGMGTPAGDAAFENSLISRFNTTYNGTSANNWNVAPSKPTNANLFGSQTYTRSGRSYIALRAILGKDNFDKASKEIQTTFGGSSITQPQQIAVYKKWLPNQSQGCKNKLDVFFTQWWDTAYSGSPAAGNKPQITGPGLAGPGFYDANGGCLPYGVDTPGSAGATVAPTLSLTLGAPATFGTFLPGVAQTYTAGTTATVISTAGDATLTAADLSSNKPGFLVNGAFSLPQPLGGLGVIKTYSSPVSNDIVPVSFTQAIASTDALRTGAYSKTLTFTLSTTTP